MATTRDPGPISTILSALARPVTGPGAERPVLAVWICAIVAALAPPFTLPALFPVAGYLAHTLAAVADGDPAPRFLGAPRSLLRAGVGATVLVTVVLAIPVGVLLVTTAGAQSAPAVDAGDPAIVGLVALGGTVVLSVALAGAYLLPAALARYGREDSLRHALEGAGLRRICGHWAYFVAWLGGATVLGLAGAAAGAVGGVPGFGPPLAACTLSYAVLVAGHVWGRGVQRAGSG